MIDMPPSHDWHAPIIAAICYAYTRFGPVNYVEVGVDRGHTFNEVAPLCTEAHAVDISFEEYKLPKGFNDWPEGTHRWCCSSDTFFSVYQEDGWDPPQVIFIDGDHHSHQVMSDLMNALTIIADNGVIILHDTLPLEQRWMDRYCEDAYKVVETMMATFKNKQVFTIPLFPGLTLITGRYNPLGPATFYERV